MDHHDLIVIGNGPAGASLAQRLAPSGKKLPVIEPVGDRARPPDDRIGEVVFVEGRCQAKEAWYGRPGA